MTLLSLDQSSHTSGYAIFKDNKLHDFGKFEAAGKDTNDRLVDIKTKVTELIDKYNPDKVIIEDIQLQDKVANNVVTFKTLAWVQGVIIELLTDLKIPFELQLATTWKSKLNIKGRYRAEQKKNAQKHVLEKYHQEVSEDIADAICIGEAYSQNLECAWSV